MTYQEFVVLHGRDPFPGTDSDDEQMAWEDLCAGVFHQLLNDLADYDYDTEEIDN